MASPLCATCLANDRLLKPLQSFVPEKCASSWMKYGITPETMVCWECQANMLRAARFTAQVIRAQATLQALQNPKKQKSKTALRSLTRLAIRPTILVGTDNDCAMVPNDEDTDATQCQSNEMLSQLDTEQATGSIAFATQNTINERLKRLKYYNPQNTKKVSTNPPAIKVKGFANASDIAETSNTYILRNNQLRKNNSVPTVDNLILVPDNNSGLVTLVPRQIILSNSALMGAAQPMPQTASDLIIGEPIVSQESQLMLELIQEIKTEYDITGVSAQPCTVNENTDSSIKIDNVVSLNPISNASLDKRNINPAVACNTNNISLKETFNNIAKQNRKINKKGVNIDIFASEESSVAVISNPNPSNMSVDTLDFEDNIPATKIISEDSSRTACQNLQVLVEAVSAIAIPIVNNDGSQGKEPDKQNKNDEQVKEKQHTVYSKSFESYITNVLSTETAPKTYSITEVKQKRQKKEPPSQFVLKLLDHKEVMDQREVNRKHRYYQIKRYKCESCVIGWNLQSEYDSHVERYHYLTPGNVFVCEICNCQYNTREEANEHFIKHFNVYTCRTCAYAHQDIDEMKSHVCDLPASNINASSTQQPQDKGITTKRRTHRVDDVVEIIDDSDTDSAKETDDLLVPINKKTDSLLVPINKKKRKNKNTNSKGSFVNCVHCGFAYLRSSIEEHMRRRHPELIRLKANFRNN